MLGKLVPLGGGDPIPLLKESLVVGRRESCDIVLRFSYVSSNHCQLKLLNGYWYVHDNSSSNGTKVNGRRITDKRLDPGDTLTIARLKFEVRYSPHDLGAVGPPPPEGEADEILSQSLLKPAGLDRRDGHAEELKAYAQRKATRQTAQQKKKQ